MIQWRKYELVLTSILTGLTLISYLLDYARLHNAGQVEALALIFRQHGLGFNYLLNRLLPQAGVLFLYYGAYLWFNLQVVPAFRDDDKTHWTTYGYSALRLFILALLLAVGVNAATWLARPAFFSYRGVGQLFSFMGYNEAPLSNPFSGITSALIITGVYTAYAGLREQVAGAFDRADKPAAFRALVINRVILFLVVLIVLPVTAGTFHLVTNDYVYTLYLAFFMPAGMTYISETYGLFPRRASPGLDWWLAGRLLVLIFCCSLSYMVISFLLLHSFNLNLWLISWGVLLLLVTPLTWLIYRQRGYRILQLKEAEKALARSRADLYFLRSQINPHFLFNALNTLYGTALNEDAAHTAGGIQLLGDMMRFMLHDNQLDFIPVEKELAYLRNYITLQRLRTGQASGVRIEADIDAAGCDRLISPMLLIPLVENAFKHGISLAEHSWIRISFSCSAEAIRLDVCNSIHSVRSNDPEKTASGIGLANVRERLMHFYPGLHTLEYGAEGNEFRALLIIQNPAAEP